MGKVGEFIASLNLSTGETARVNCPFCRGKGTFTVTVEYDNILYNCYKNSCSVAGAERKDMDVYTIQRILAERNASESDSKQYLCPFVAPPYLVPYPEAKHHIDTMFLQRYDIDQNDVMYDVRQDRLVFPVYAERVGLVDAVGRSLTNRKPKWLRYSASPVPYISGWGNTAVIVEDAISAYVVGKLFDNASGVALLGTQLTAFHKQYIQKWFGNKIIVALDPDARDKTLKIARELDAKALNLQDDLKYKYTEDLDNLKEMLDE
tara:strand:+ start:818 stop:1606 length:789 start_codon:yes stop_codon:yes gene_type:complete